jgi:hypothetical protein
MEHRNGNKHRSQDVKDDIIAEKMQGKAFDDTGRTTAEKPQQIVLSVMDRKSIE